MINIAELEPIPYPPSRVTIKNQVGSSTNYPTSYIRHEEVSFEVTSMTMYCASVTMSMVVYAIIAYE
jgi:hypothetical protein